MSEALGLIVQVSDKFRRENPGVTGQLLNGLMNVLKEKGVADPTLEKERDTALRADEFVFRKG